MIYEMRTYTLRPGVSRDWLNLYETVAIPAIRKVPAMTLIGYFRAETGPLNRLIHVWSYPDAMAREAALAALGANPDWTEGFVGVAQQYLVSQETTLLKPVSFSPLQ